MPWQRWLQWLPEAARLASPYYRQDEKELNYVLTADPHRVSYVKLTPTDEDLQQIEDMGLKMGVLHKRIPMNELIDRYFVPQVITPAPIDAAMIPKLKAVKAH